MAIKAQQIIRTEKLGGGAPGAFIPQGVIERRGLQAVTQATGALAKGLFEFGQMMQTSARRDMVSHQYSQAQIDIADAELRMRKEPDPSLINGKFSRELDDIRSDHSSQILDPVARNMFQQKMIEYGGARQRQMKFFAWDRQVEVQRAHIVEDLESTANLIEDSGLDDTVNYAILREGGTDIINGAVPVAMSPEAAAILNSRWLKKSATRRAERIVKSDPFSALDALKAKSWKGQFPFISDSEHLGLMDKATTRINQINKVAAIEDKKAEADEKHLKDTMRELARKEVSRKINFPNAGEEIDPFNDIQNNPSLTPGDISHWLDVVKKNAEAKLNGKKSVYEEWDERTYAELKERIYLRPESIKSADEIWAFHGKGKKGGLSTTKAEELVKTWESRTKPGKEQKSVVLTRAVKTLGAMLRAGLFGDISVKENVLEANTRHNEFVKATEIFVTNNPDADDKQVMEYVKEITTDDQKGWMATVWEAFTLLPFGFATEALIGAIVKSEAEKRFGLGKLPDELKPVDSKRLRAIDILRKNNKRVNDKTIKSVMEQLE